MACLIKRGNGIYYAVVSRRGKRVWTSLRTRDSAEARRLFDELEADSRRRPPLRFEDFAREYVSRAELRIKHTTVAMYEYAFQSFGRIMGNPPLRRITPLDIEEFKTARAREVSPVTLNIQLKHLRAAFGEAVRLRLLPENPFDGVPALRVPFKEMKHLCEGEFRKLLSAISDAEFRHLVCFAVCTMMRRGEVLNMRWQDVDLGRREIHIRSHGEFEVKGKKPRCVPMHEWVHTFLSSRQRRGEYVFSSDRGEQLRGETVSKRFKKYVRRAGIDPGIHFHSLRHTGISWLMNHGVQPQFVQRIAGHSSLGVTQIYTHLEDGALLVAVNAFTSPALS